MAEAGVCDEAGFNVLVLEAAVELEAVGRGNALVVAAGLNERWRFGLFDVGYGRRFGVDGGVVPRRRVQVLARERRNVRADVVGGPIADPGADGNGFEA